MERYNLTDVIKFASEVIDCEIKGLQVLRQQLDYKFLEAIDLILKIKGRVVISGIGKSGHIGNKISSTLASTGTPALFVHPSEASHGDLGMITKDDCLVLISNSGNSKELNDIITYAHKLAIPLISITSSLKSDLGQASQIILKIPDNSEAKEACPLGKAPTTSSTAILALGDALAITLLKLKGFNESSFKDLHPGGKIGASLKQIDEIMHKSTEVPIIGDTEIMSKALITITSYKFGCTAIVNKSGEMIGVITDGDIRRHMSEDFLKLNAHEVMTSNFTYVLPSTLAITSFRLMQKKSITNLFVLNNKKQPVGVIHIHDLLNLGIV